MSRGVSSGKGLLAEVFERAIFGVGTEKLSLRLSSRQRQVLKRIIACGWGDLGAHVYCCKDCGERHILPHSCRDRHCPRCQYQQAGKWLEAQQECLLPVPYFHVVFTLPHLLNSLVRQNRKVALKLLFQAASSTLLDFCKNNLHAVPGLTAVLHTWGQTLCEHYHLHVLITGGGLSLSEDEWIASDQGNCNLDNGGNGIGKWLFSTKALAKVYQGKYLEGLEQAFEKGELKIHGAIKHWSDAEIFKRQLKLAAKRKWNVYCKAPFAGPEQVLGYLAHYTHRVAISPRRVVGLDLEKDTVTFTYKNYRNRSQVRKMTLSVQEFTRRFAQHILPQGFCKIRHYGILSTRNRKAKVALSRSLLEGCGQTEVETCETKSGAEATTAIESQLAMESDTEGKDERESVRVCPHCGSEMVYLAVVFGINDTVLYHAKGRAARGPPQMTATAQASG